MSNFKNVLFAILLFCYNSSSFIMKTHNTNVILKCNNNNDRERYNPFQKKYYMPRDLNTNKTNIPKKYLLTRPSYIEEIKRLNSKNISIQTESILGDTNNEYLAPISLDQAFSNSTTLGPFVYLSDVSTNLASFNLSKNVMAFCISGQEYFSIDVIIP